MKNRLVLTLTTTRGSRQYSLSKLAKYLIIISAALVFIGFFIGNFYWAKTSDQLTLLALDHRTLEYKYEDVLGNREVYKTELDQLSDTFRAVESERNNLQRQFYSLTGQYQDVLGSTQEYQSEVNRLTDDLESVESRRQKLEQESSSVMSERSQWANALKELERKMGFPASETMSLERSMELQQIANERLFLLRGIPNGTPLQSGRMTDRFGTRIHPISKKRKMHNGVDWSASRGTPIYSTADGAVEYSGYHKKSGYGKLLIISHNFGFKTYYGHMDKLSVKTGSVVRKGQLIGYSGNTGISTGPHLHYEVRYLFKPLNPGPFLKWGMGNYENLFTQVKGISWESLREMHPLNQLEAPLL